VPLELTLARSPSRGLGVKPVSPEALALMALSSTALYPTALYPTALSSTALSPPRTVGPKVAQVALLNLCESHGS